MTRTVSIRLTYVAKVISTGVAVLHMCACIPYCAADDMLPANIVQQLSDNATATRQLAVDYQVTRTSPLPRAEFFERIQRPDTMVFFKTNSYRLILQANKWLKFTSIATFDNNTKLFHHKDTLTTFNGELEYFVDPRKHGSVIEILDGPYHKNTSPLYSEFGYNAYIAAAGLSIPMDSVDSWLPLESTIVSMLKQGAHIQYMSPASTATRGDFEITIGAADGKHRFILDLEKHCALRVHEELALDGTLKYSTTNSELGQLAGQDVWLPRRSRVTCYTWASLHAAFDSPIAFEDLVVTKLDTSTIYPDKTFTIDWKQPGNLIGDSRVKGALGEEGGIVSYRVPADLKQLDTVIAAAADEQQPGSKGRQPRILVWLLWVNIAVIVLVSCALFLRRTMARTQ